MRNLFNTKLKIIVVLAVLLTAVLAVMAGLTNRSIPELMVQGILAPFRAAGTSLTKTAERYYSYMFRYEALEAENEALKASIAQMEDVARQADATARENARLRKAMALKEVHEDYDMTDAYIIGWSSTDWSNTFTINR
ncbi:MAG: rod shape-determining protein MreC, partial [Faecousia sp.]